MCTKIQYICIQIEFGNRTTVQFEYRRIGPRICFIKYVVKS